jgi:transcriptional regulator with XRE-family HTH domain
MIAAHDLRLADNISFRIVDLRKNALGVTQAVLATRAGVGKQQVSNWETGTQKPARTRLVSWASRERWPVEIFAEGGPLPSETLKSRLSANALQGETNPLEVPHMTYLQQADGILRDTLRHVNAPYHVRVATAYAWLAARESRAPIPITEIAGRLGRELGSDISRERAMTILQVRPNELDVVEALARVLHVDPSWLTFGPEFDAPAGE